MTCHRSVLDYTTLRLYCTGHRTHVERDDHCNDWEADC
jgi:hypothetical protein